MAVSKTEWRFLSVLISVKFLSSPTRCIVVGVRKIVISKHLVVQLNSVAFILDQSTRTIAIDMLGIIPIMGVSPMTTKIRMKIGAIRITEGIGVRG